MDKDMGKDMLENTLYYTSPRIIDIVTENKLNIHSIYSYCSSCISLLHGKDLLETQDIKLFKTFLDKLIFKADNENIAAKRIVASEHFKLISSYFEQERYEDSLHPKVTLVTSIIQNELEGYNNKKLIVFTQYRQMATILKKNLKSILPLDIKIEKFIGQASKVEDRGFSQGEQEEIMEKFRTGEINIIIATSVAEEGLDIPNVDAIIFYEPIPSEIRTIQRRGRTGRHAPGRCYILITKNTVDVPFYKVACTKEDSMKSILSNEEFLELKTVESREKINFKRQLKPRSEWDIIQDFNERKKKEKELLANRSIEEIIEEMDNFAQSEQYKKFKEYGVTFFSDVAHISKPHLTKKVLTLKGKKKKQQEKRHVKRSLNKNLKSLINLTKTYSAGGKIKLQKLKEIAEQEGIDEKKFFIHLNQVCYLGYLEKQKDDTLCLIKDLE